MRHIEKFKKIFACCGKECTANTNGQALDQLVTLAENGELGSGGGSGAGLGIFKIRLQKSSMSVYDEQYLIGSVYEGSTGGLSIPPYCKNSMGSLNSIDPDLENAKIPQALIDKGVTLNGLEFDSSFRGTVAVDVRLKLMNDSNSSPYTEITDDLLGDYEIECFMYAEDSYTVKIPIGKIIISIV